MSSLDARPRRWSSLKARSLWKALVPISLVGNVYTTYLYFGGDASATYDRAETRHLTARIGGEAPYLPEVTTLLDTTALADSSSLWDFTWSLHPSRLLSESSSSSGSTTTSAAGGDSSSHGHQHDALLFLFNAILIGTGVLHLSSIYHSLQLSIALFVLGMVFSLILEGLSVKDKTGKLGESYVMWMDIDPHLLLFTMLPTLLAGDAMTIDTSVARRVGKQCLYLAGPGVLIQASLAALFLQYWFDWSFLLSLTTASILCATDPVAVVALLKELGASPSLTVQIQGESLLNDGTAIVLYTIAYDMLRGQVYDFADISMFLVKVAIMAFGLGVFLGLIFFTWIRLASDRFNHSSSIIQILLTLCAAYWSFVLAEGVLKMSGVLATVGCSLALAHNMWPYIVERDAMLDFWHALESLGNIVIFFLGGALTGASMVKIEAIDYLNLLAVYMVLLFLRGSLIFLSRPLLQFLHKDKDEVSVADAFVMTWGGLRGAVGLALAIQVRRGKALGEDGIYRMDDDQANRVLFFVAGIAFLTTCINASTCPLLVDWLGITNLPEAEARLLSKFNEQLVNFSQAQDNPEEVTAQLQHVLGEIAHEVEAARKNNLYKSGGFSGQSRKSASQAAAKVIGQYKAAFEAFSEIPETDLAKCQALPTDLDGEIPHMVDLVANKPCDIEISKAFNNTFLSVVNNNYWKQINNGTLKPGSEEADLLFTSIRFSLHKPDLVDYSYLGKFIQSTDAEKGDRALIEGSLTAFNANVSNRATSMQEQTSLAQNRETVFAQPMISTSTSARAMQDQEARESSLLGKLVMSSTFNVACILAIVSNVFCVLLEEIVRADDDTNPVWIVIEGFFTVVFLLEFVVKFAYMKCAYFQSPYNVFDFFLVLLGILGFIVSLVAAGSTDELGTGSETRVIKVARVLRTMRFFRLFRLLHAGIGKDRLVSEDLAETMKRMQTMNSFVAGHLEAQKLCLRFFCGKVNESNEVELARCILQSMIAVYSALQHLVALIGQMEINTPNLVEELRHVRQRKHIIEELEEFVMSAMKDGAISERQAGSLLHPLQHELAECIQNVERCRQGYTDAFASHVLNSQDVGADNGVNGKGLAVAADTDGFATQYGKGEVGPVEDEPDSEPAGPKSPEPAAPKRPLATLKKKKKDDAPKSRSKRSSHRTR